MNSIQWARTAFGFSQSQLAIYLSVSLAMLKLAETNRRSLPTAALLKLANLQLLQEASKNTPSTKVGNGLPANPFNKKMDDEIAKSKRQISKAKQQLAVAKKAHQQAIGFLSLAVSLSKQLPNGAEGEKDALWLEVQCLEAEAAIKKNGLESQMLLQWKIDCLEFGVAKAKKLASNP